MGCHDSVLLLGREPQSGTHGARRVCRAQMLADGYHRWMNVSVYISYARNKSEFEQRQTVLEQIVGLRWYQSRPVPLQVASASMP